ncbi:hypothetical protein A1F96_06353 [Pyrenophora tritici-repentis]|nr:hypothetical protein A1F99_100160 [Pyrenophora tritici-repentis]PZD27910.1 hypothetical protein A1F96_06353 [Pyrenophora tritici-repentis]
MSRMRCTYVAGIWREHLEKTLTWYPPIDSTGSRPKVYVAPSWSWASLNGGVEASMGRYKDVDYAIHVEDVALTYATEDVTGAVTGGWLDLRGSLKPMKLHLVEYEDDFSWCMTLNRDFARKQDETDKYEQREFLHPARVSLDIDPMSDTEFDDDNTEGHLLFMPVCKTKDYSQSLMVRLADEATPSFQRIG